MQSLLRHFLQVNLAVTVLLANTVILLLVSDSLPEQSATVPILCEFEIQKCLL